MKFFKKILPIIYNDIHSRMNVSKEFIAGIYDEENSWSFISKLAQFIEGVFTKILVQHLNDKDTYGTISNLPQAVRLNLAFDLKLITKEQKFLFLTIAEIRNDYIHNIHNVEVDLSDYLKTLKPSRTKEIYKRFSHFTLGENITSVDSFVEDCVNAIFTVCILEMARIHSKAESNFANAKHAQYRAEQALELIPLKADGAFFAEDNWMVREYVKQAKECLTKAGAFEEKFINPRKPI